MFTKEDYKNYFQELENILKKSVVIYTDLINLIDDRSIHNRLHAMAREAMDNFRFIAEEKNKLA